MNAPQVGVTHPQHALASSETVAQKVAHYVSGFRYEDIPEATRERAKLLVLDAVGIALASTHYDFSHRILSGLNALNEGGSSSLIGTPGKLALRDAVIFNGVLVHGLDYDDTHLPSIRKSLYNGLADQGYFDGSPEKVRNRWVLFGIFAGAATGLLALAWMLLRGVPPPAIPLVPLVTSTRRSDWPYCSLTRASSFSHSTGIPCVVTGCSRCGYLAHHALGVLLRPDESQ